MKTIKNDLEEASGEGEEWVKGGECPESNNLAR